MTLIDILAIIGVVLAPSALAYWGSHLASSAIADQRKLLWVRVAMIAIVLVGAASASTAIVLSNRAATNSERDLGAIMTHFGIANTTSTSIIAAQSDSSETGTLISVSATYRMEPKSDNKYAAVYYIDLINNGAAAELTAKYWMGSSKTGTPAQVLQNVKIVHALGLGPSRDVLSSYPLQGNANPFGPNTKNQILKISTNPIFTQTDARRISSGIATSYISGVIAVSRKGQPEQDIPFCWYSQGSQLNECPIVR